MLNIVTVSAQILKKPISKNLLIRHKKNPALTGLLRREITDHVLRGESFTLTKTAMCWKVQSCLTIFFCYAQNNVSECLIRY